MVELELHMVVWSGSAYGGTGTAYDSSGTAYGGVISFTFAFLCMDIAQTSSSPPVLLP